MSNQLVRRRPSPFWLLSDWLDENEWPSQANFQQETGLTVFEDQKNVHVEAALPGVTPENVEVTYEKGVLWIRGEAKEEEEDKNRKYYRRSARSFSYQLAVPGAIDEHKEPTAVVRQGIIRLSFPKKAAEQPKKIKVQKG